MAPAQHTPERRRRPSSARWIRAGAAGITGAILLGACAGAPEYDPSDRGERIRLDVLEVALDRSPRPETGDLRIRLAFGSLADLDLYVTDPLQESIYFARRETRSGGTLDADARCEDPPPRIETAVYPAAAPGVYRIGVDYGNPCSDRAEPAGFVVEVAYGEQRLRRRFDLQPLRFEPIVWEVVVPEQAGAQKGG